MRLHGSRIEISGACLRYDGHFFNLSISVSTTVIRARGVSLFSSFK